MSDELKRIATLRIIEYYNYRHSSLIFHHSSLNKKGYKPHKPDSVSKLSFICDKHYCSPVAAYPETLGEPPSSVSIRGITVPKVYPCNVLLHCIVGSYPTFSPSPQNGAVIFCGTVSSCCQEPALHRWVALYCPDFPPQNKFRGDSSGL